MNVIDELTAVCGLLDNGVIDGDRIQTLLRESELEHRNGGLSLHRSISEGRCEVKDQLVIQLRRLERNRNDSKRDEIALGVVSRLRGLLDLFIDKYGENKTDCIEAIAATKFFKAWKSKESQNDRARLVDLTESQWSELKAKRRIGKEMHDYFYDLITDYDGGKTRQWVENHK